MTNHRYIQWLYTHCKRCHKKWRNEEVVCRKPEKIIDREFVNNFSNQVLPPPRGKKKFIASDCVYEVLSRNYWAKKTNLRVTHKQVELLSTSTYHLAHEPIHRRDRKNNFTQHSLIYELDCCKHSKNPLRGRGARLPQGYHRRGGGDHYKPRYYNLSL